MQPGPGNSSGHPGCLLGCGTTAAQTMTTGWWPTRGGPTPSHQVWQCTRVGGSPAQQAPSYPLALVGVVVVGLGGVPLGGISYTLGQAEAWLLRARCWLRCHCQEMAPVPSSLQPSAWCRSGTELGYPRPHSLLSPTATYQKIVPVAVPQEPPEAGSSYSVTLYISEQAAAMPRARCHSFVARPGSPQDMLGEKTPGPPRPKNKSVFKKFFGKKE